jgi:hypothetical protein
MPLDINALNQMSAPQQLAVIAQAARTYGIHFHQAGQVQGFIPQNLAMDADLAMDALPALVTTTSSGIPAFLTNYVDPKLIEVLVSPNKAAQILGENQKGDWTTPTAFFPVVESAGEVSSYGDYSTNGEVTANTNWPQRQSYHYQTVTQWGERELDQMGKGRIDWASRLNIASAMIMNKFQNKTYFFGVAGLQNYGILNDPSLSTPLSPGSKAAGGFLWTNATANEIFADIEALVLQLITQSNGVIDMNSAMKLVMSPKRQVALTTTNQYNVNVFTLLKSNFPNMSIETAPEYTTTSGELVQLIVENVEGQDTGYCAFTEKMRAHAVERKTSSFLQKKSGGTWGAIILQPYAIAQMLGV